MTISKIIDYDEENETFNLLSESLPKFKFDFKLREIPINLLDWDELISKYEKQIEVEINSNSQRLILECLGVACRITNRCEDAEKYLLKALSLSISQARTEAVIKNLIRLADVYRWLFNFDKAKLIYDQAKALILENNTSESIHASFHQHLGKYYFDQKYFGIAACEFQLAYKIRSGINASADQMESSKMALAEAKKQWPNHLEKNISIRIAKVSDAESVHNVHMFSINNICAKDYTADEIRVWGGRKYKPSFRIPSILNEIFLVVEFENSIEGFCQMEFVKNNKNSLRSSVLHGLYLTPEILKKNIGNVLIKLVIEYCRSENVKTIKLRSTLTALNFYKKMGFKQNGDIGGPIIDGIMVRGYPMKMDLE
ncbi:MAG: GNAT family N-acetyltransferase [Pseudobdellovibrio sp.]